MTDLNHFLFEKRSEYQKRQHKVIVLHFPSILHHIPVCDTLESLNWDVLPHADYLPDLASYYYRLFSSMGHAHAEQRFGSYEDVKKWFDEWFAAKREDFPRVRFTNCQKLGKCITKRWRILLIQHFLSLHRIFKRKNPHFKLEHLVFLAKLYDFEIVAGKGWWWCKNFHQSRPKPVVFGKLALFLSDRHYIW